MKIGLFFGSFNPIHHGHLIVASHILQNADLQEVWFIVTPQNPHKTDFDLLPEKDRLTIVWAAIADEARFIVSDVEFSLPRPTYTIQTLRHLREKYLVNEFVVIMGSDSLQNIQLWKDYDQILSDFAIYVYNRSEHQLPSWGSASRIRYFDGPFLQISSTYIRQNIKNKKSIRYLVPESVRAQIELKKYWNIL